MDISGDFCNVLDIDRTSTHHSMCIMHHCRVRSLKKTDIKLSTLKRSYNRLIMTIDRPLLNRGATNECAGTTICMPPS